VQVTVTEPAALPAVILSSNDTNLCIGQALNLYETGADATVWYWSGPAGALDSIQSPSIAALAATDSGRYYVTITDANGCQNLDSIEIAVYKVPTIDTIVSSPVSNCGLNDGSITVTATGASGVLEYSKDGGTNWQASNIYSGITNGSYNVSIRYTIPMCQVDNATATAVSAPSSPNIDSIVPADITNCGLSDGGITIYVTGGSGSYEYSIDSGATWQTSNVYTNLVADNYYIVARNNDSSCITYNAGVTAIDTPEWPVITDVDSSDVTNCGLSDGVITITATGASGTLAYSIDAGVNWQVTNVFDSLAAGNYNISVRYNNATCKVDKPGITKVNEPVIPVIDSVIPSNVTNCGMIDGKIVVYATGTSGTLEYSKDGGTNWQASSTFNGLTNNSYNVSVRYTGGLCLVNNATATVVGAPSAPVIDSVLHSNVSDCGFTDGTIDVYVSGGLGAYEYSIDSGSTWGTSANFTNKDAGNYRIAARNNDSTCRTDYATAVLITKSILPVIDSVSSDNVSDCGLTDGAIRIYATAVSGALEYSSDSGSTWQATSVYNSLSDGNYDIAVRYSNATCRVNNSSEITITAPVLPIIDSVIKTNVISCLLADGSITIAATGTTGVLNYSIDGGITWQASPIFNSLVADTFNVSVRYANATCKVDNVISTIISPPILPTINITTGTACADDLLSYSVGTTVSIGTVTSTKGLVTNTLGNIWSITNIPTDSNIVLTVTDVNSCAKTLAVAAPNCNCPVMSMPVSSGDTAICAGENIPSLSATVDSGQTIDWYDASTFGNLVLSGNTTFTPTVAGTYYAEARDTVSTCISTMRTAISLTINAKPSLLVTNPDAACAPATVNIDSSIITTGSTAGLNFEYYTNGAASIVYPTPTAATTGTYYIKGTVPATGCSDTSAVVVLVNPLPVATLVSDDADSTICEGASITFTATAGSSNYVFKKNGLVVQNSASNTYTTTSLQDDDSIIVVATNLGCPNSSSSRVTTVIPNVTIITQPVSDTLCIGETAMLFAKASGSILGYQWYKGSTLLVGKNNDTLLLTNISDADTGSYSLTINGSCAPVVTNSVRVELSIPVVNTIANDTIGYCNNTYALTTNVSAHAPYHTDWTPSNGSLSSLTAQSPLISHPKVGLSVEYKVMLTDKFGCKAYDSVEILTDTIQVTTIADATIGKCKTITLTSVLTSSDPSKVGFTWFPVGGLSNSDILSPVVNNPVVGSVLYTLTATDMHTCTDTASVRIIAEDLPTIEIPMTENYRRGICDSTRGISADVIGVAPVVVSWLPTTQLNTTSGTSVIINKPVVGKTMYHATATDKYNCTAVDSMEITITGYPLTTMPVTATNASGAAKICYKDTVVIKIEGTQEDHRYSAYKQTDHTQVGSSRISTYAGQVLNLKINPTDLPNEGLFGGYYVKAVSDEGCESKLANTVIVNYQVLPKPVITGPNILYDYESDSIYSVASVFAGRTYQWTYDTGSFNGSSTNSNVMYTPPTNFGGIVSLRLVETNTTTTCKGDTTYPIIVFNVDTLKVKADNKFIGCVGTSQSMVFATPSGGVEPYTLQWLPINQFGDTIKNLPEGVYNVVLVDAYNRTVTDFTEITPNSPLDIITSVNDVSCFGAEDGSVTITVTGGAPGDMLYNWSNSKTTKDISNVGPGRYTVTVKDLYNCYDTSEAIVVEPDELLIDTTLVKHPWCDLSSDGELQVDATGGLGALTYQWSTGSTEQYLKRLSSGTYTVTVTDANNCSSELVLVLNNNQNQCIRVPSAFSPNGDGVNDYWDISMLDMFYPDCTIEVYDRWGVMIFKSKGYSKPWDGRHNGYPLPANSYHYIIDFNNGGRILSGQITIIK